MTPLDALRRRFESSFGFPLPAEIEGVETLRPVDARGLLLGSAAAVPRVYLTQGDVDDFVEGAPDGYRVAGFWGHGINSYGFYYCRADAKTRIFFRLPYGGVYGDPEADGARVRVFLTAWIDYERRVGPDARRLLALESMGAGHYRIETGSGAVLECTRSLLGDPRFGVHLTA
jgi:hypothetical protein